MSTDQTPARNGSRMRRFAIIAIVATFGLSAAWVAIWIYMRGTVETELDRVLAESSQGPASLSCDDRRVGGFPFRLAVSCSQAGIAMPQDALTANLNGLDVVTLVYSPQHIIADLSAPLEISWDSPASPLVADWSSGRTSLRIADNALGRLSAVFDDLATVMPTQSLAATHAEFHVRPGDDDQRTDIAFSATGATLTMPPETSAPAGIDATMRVDMPPEMLLAGNFLGREIEVRDLQVRLSAEQGRLSATGSLTVGKRGSVNGEIVVVTENVAALAAYMQTLPAEIRAQTLTTIGGIIALSRPVKNDQGNAVSELSLTIRDDVIYAGERKIGELLAGS